MTETRSQYLKRVALARAHRLITPTPDPESVRRELRERIDGGGQAEIYFLCHGNICRSPFAEHRLRMVAGDPVSVRSAGFYEEVDRGSPQSAIDAAREFNVDLSTHSSSLVDRSVVTSADLVFVMDFQNYVQFKGEFDEWEDKLFFLGSLTDSAEMVLSDPYGADIDDFRRTYQEISDAVAVLEGILDP